MQTSLFDTGAPEFDSQFDDLRRLPLGLGAWVDYLPNWIRGHQWLYEALAGTAAWERNRRMMYERMVDVPRLTAPAPRQGPAAELLRELSRALSLHYWTDLPNISLAWYRGGEDSVAPHSDKVGRYIEQTVVAIVSVGAPRRFVLRALRESSLAPASRSYLLGWGDLLVMGGTCQRHWHHGVPKVAHADPRISIMFRPKETTTDPDQRVRVVKRHLGAPAIMVADTQPRKLGVLRSE